MTEFSKATKQANCNICLIAEAMKGCPACAFYIEYPRATAEDVARIWEQLWGDATPEQVQAIYEAEKVFTQQEK